MKRGLQAVWFLALCLTLTGVQANAQEFLIGSDVPLTGKLARVGNGMHEGIMVATEMFNKKHPEHSVKVITIDNESSPAKAVSAVEKLASEHVLALTGGYGSNIIGPASDTANKAGLVYITSGGVSDALTQRGYKTFFRINNTAGYSKAMIGLFADMKITSLSVVYSTKEATEGLAKDVEAAMSAKGVKVTMHAFDPSINDFKPVINKIRLQDRSEAIAMVGYENDYVNIIRAAKVMKPPTVKAMVGVWSLATSKMASEFPDLMPNVYGTALLPYPAEFNTPDSKEFAETYNRLFNKYPDYLGQFGYVQTQLLYAAMLRAFDKGTLDKGGLAQELSATDQDTLIGRVVFDANGDNPNFQHRMGQHQDGKVVIVWPTENANGKMNFPGVPW